MKNILLTIACLALFGCTATANRIPDGKTDADWEADERYCLNKSGKVTGFWAATGVGLALNVSGADERYKNCLKELGWIREPGDDNRPVIKKEPIKAVETAPISSPEKEVSMVATAKQHRTSEDSSTFINHTLGMKFILIPTGTFTMGQHQVTITKPFYMQTTEVTQDQWQKVMWNNPSYLKTNGGNCPVEQVSWNDVQQFIQKLNDQEGTDKYRLPTEAEWEYAARSGGKQEEYAGTNSKSDLDEYAWYKSNSDDRRHPVGQKRPNGLGLYDMSGNVWEWVQDWYGNYPVGHVTDPVGPSSGQYRVIRGGTWDERAKYCASAYRYNNTPESKHYNLGFRLARTAKKEVPIKQIESDQRNKGIRGIVLMNGDVIEGQILSWDPDTVKIRTKEGKILSYDFKKEVQRFITE
jgi:formylglycine-generating enzyme required for sulfatase activity